LTQLALAFRVAEKQGWGTVPIWVEEFALAVLATVFVGAVILNVLKMDWIQRTGLGIGILGFSIYLAQSLYLFNESKKSTSSVSEEIKKEQPPLTSPKWSAEGSKLILGVAASKQARWVSMTLNTAELSPFAKDFFLMIIVRVLDNSAEALTDTRIAKSSLFAITGEVRTIQVDLSKDFIARSDAVSKRHDQMSLQFYLVLIPKHIRAEQVLTVADVVAVGGQQLQRHPSPEIRSPVPFR
jgi:hypothetical protein